MRDARTLGRRVRRESQDGGGHDREGDLFHVEQARLKPGATIASRPAKAGHYGAAG